MNLKSCILAMFALSFLTSCTYSKQVSEKMEILEGVYTLLNPVSISIPGKSYLPASVVETDGHWVFSFMIPVQFNGKTVLHQFEGQTAKVTPHPSRPSREIGPSHLPLQGKAFCTILRSPLFSA